MSQLRFPLRERTRDPADEASLRRIWEGIDARFPHRRRRAPAVGIASALALAGAIAVLVLVGHDPGPLRLAGGQPIVAVDAPGAGARMSMSDGSSIQLSAGTRLDPLESSGTSFVAFLERGRAEFEVRPGGPRRWRIECGLATVEVVGTHFTCEREPGRLRVAVERGTVLVTGERISDRVRRLTAGESLTVGELAPASAPRAPAVGAEEPPATPPATAPPPHASDRAAPAAAGNSWRELARGGRHAEAFAALGAQGLRREARRLGVEELLLALADVARLSGHPAEAEGPLQRILTEFSSDPQASLAAFALGRLELDALGRPRRAAAALERALALGIPQSLKEDVRARLVEAYARAGDRTAARAAAADYAREFPGGRYAGTIESRLSEP